MRECKSHTARRIPSTLSGGRVGGGGTPVLPEGVTLPILAEGGYAPAWDLGK